MLQAMKALGVIFMMSVLCSEKVWGVPYSRKAIPTEAGESICSLSRKLKDVSPWTQGLLETLKKTQEVYASKLLDWQLHFHGSSECELNQSILDNIRTDLEKVNKEIQKLSGKAILAGALAAKSAGRLDEFITVFANAQKGSTSVFDVSSSNAGSFCLGGKGDPARRRDLLDCFPDGEKLEIKEGNLAKIPESVPDKSEINLTAALRIVNHSILEAHFRRIYWDDIHAGCNLVNGKDGILSGTLNDKLWWGGGILTIGKSFDGDLSKVKSSKDKESNNGDSAATWTSSPHNVPHLQKTLATFQDFKDAASIITQKFSEIEKIEKQIEPCLSNETTEQGPTQSCFQSAVKLNAELQAANALLARYHKEKGPLPSGSTLILHQSLFNVCFYFAFLL
ncbi:Transferrin receptor-like, ESAG6-like [Trypanosoma congolense IL3000]|uniref:Transferrin receptor-like, ESAG6-like n=1 Tax=Trypanosoma congolense (strain IL3000) TaxID=1068625 RepID=F9WHB9_TRYCI|nr:Transferrin receptor-like, ESAG6-like [Trypanosoma congolense IL3000]